MQDKMQFDIRTTQQIIKRIGLIDQFKGTWRVFDRPDNRYLRDLKRIATIQSIGSSTRIEGSLLSDGEIEQLIKNLKINNLQSRDEQEVVGYYDVLELIFEQHEFIPLTISTVHGLHNLLLKQSEKDGRHRGKFKELNNQVVANYPDGTQRVIFQTTAPYLVESEMQTMLDWAKSHFEQQELHPLLVIAAFIYEFLSVHPYHDGNGRLSRLLTNLLLIQQGYDFVQYVSLEHIVEKQKTVYYQSLMEGQKNRGQPNENISAWVLFFLDTIVELVQKLNAKIAAYQSTKGPLNERQAKIMRFFSAGQPLKMSDIAEMMPEANLAVLRKDVYYLKQHFFLSAFGQGKATFYQLAEEAQ